MEFRGSERRGQGRRNPQSRRARGEFYNGEGGGVIECPYNVIHLVDKARFVSHLEKCRENYKREMKMCNRIIEMVHCRFNWAHHLPRPEICSHEKGCLDQYDVRDGYHNRTGEISRKGSPSPSTYDSSKRFTFKNPHLQNEDNRNDNFRRRGRGNSQGFVASNTSHKAPPPIINENWDLCTKDTPTYDPKIEKPDTDDVFQQKQQFQPRQRRHTKIERNLRMQNRRKAPIYIPHHGYNSSEDRPPREAYGDSYGGQPRRDVSNDSAEYNDYYGEQNVRTDSKVSEYCGEQNVRTDSKDFEYCGEQNFPRNKDFELYGDYYKDESERPRRSRHESVDLSASPGPSSCFYYRRNGEDQSESYHSDPESEWDIDINNYMPSRMTDRSHSASSTSVKTFGNNPSETSCSPACVDDSEKTAKEDDCKTLSFDWDSDG